MPVAGMHANDKPTIPVGQQTQLIKDLIDTARKTDQMRKVMQFPPINHNFLIMQVTLMERS